jgi:hypothetical protein
MKKQVILGLTAVAVVLLAWFGYRAYRASRDLVTLDVRNADLRQVIRQIEWQTWEIIMVHKDATGTVTFNVKDTPLTEVLNIINEQTGCPWTALYPLYTSGRSLVAFKKSVRGELVAAESGWTNLNSRGGFGRGGMGGGGMFGANLRAENDQVSFNFANQDLEIATLALARFAQARVVPEDGTSGKVNFRVEKVPVEKVVKQLAKQTHRKWDRFYAVQAGFMFGRRGDGPPRGDRGPGGGPPPGDGPQFGRRGFGDAAFAEATNRLAFDTNQFGTNGPPFGRRGDNTAMRERMEQVMQTLPLEERKQIEEARQQPPGGGRQGGMEGRMARGVLNTTPSQRVERDRRMAEMRQRFQQRQQGQQGQPQRPGR